MTFRAWSSVDSIIFEGGHSRKKRRRQDTSDLAPHIGTGSRYKGLNAVQAVILKSLPDFSTAYMTDSIFLDAVMSAFFVPISSRFLL